VKREEQQQGKEKEVRQIIIICIGRDEEPIWNSQRNGGSLEEQQERGEGEEWE
jgi:hypothetical protein